MGVDELEKELALLRARYLSELDARLAALQAAAARREDDETSAKEALRVAHNLRGTASIYGLDALSAAAGRLEDRLAEVGCRPDDETETLLEAVSAAASAALESDG